MQSVMQMFVARFASEGPLMQSVMQMFVARFASEGPRRTLLADAAQATFNHKLLLLLLHGCMGRKGSGRSGNV